MVEETGQEISLEKEQGKPEKISRLAIGIKITQVQPLPGSGSDALCYANARGESIARHSTPRSEAWEGSCHLPISSFNRDGGLVFEILLPPAFPTPRLSPSNTQRLIHKDEMLRKQILEQNIFLLVTLHFSLPLA